MGMYTEIFVNVDLKQDVPASVIDVLRAMCSREDSPCLESLPSRWSYLFRAGRTNTSCAHLTQNNYGRWSLLAKGDIKNYEGEIEAFFDWLMPWIDAYKGDFIGFSLYEEDTEPTLFHFIERDPR